jgi:hypothetical protein
MTRTCSGASQSGKSPARSWREVGLDHKNDETFMRAKWRKWRCLSYGRLNGKRECHAKGVKMPRVRRLLGIRIHCFFQKMLVASSVLVGVAVSK